MEFTRLRVSGFKSFSDPVEIEFDTGLTGVVGPNGCGKSNIVDALRWVMGESSAKGLRGGEMDDIIFGGSALRPPFDLAEVALALRQPDRANGDDSKDGGLKDLEIVRRIGRGTGSSFRINGKEARGRDIQLVFADAGSGSRSPAIIGQGRVSFIVEAKPEERRRLLEDAAGIGGLHGRRREAELKLQATEANLARVQDQIEAKEARERELKKQSRQAERYRKLQAEIRESERLLLLARYREGRAALDTAEAGLAKAGAEDTSARERAAEAVAGYEKAASALPERRARVSALNATIARNEEKRQALEATRAHQARERLLLERRVEETEQQRNALKASIDETAQRRRELGDELARLGETLAGHEAALGDRGREERALHEALRESDKCLAELGTALAALETQLGTARARHDERTRRKAAVETELARLGTVDDDALIEVAGRKCQEAEAAVETATDERARLSRRASEQGEALEAHRQALEEARHAHGEAKAHLRDLEARLSSVDAEARSREERRRLLGRSVERCQSRRRELEAELAEVTGTDAVPDAEALAETLARCRDTLAMVQHEAAEAVESRDTLAAEQTTLAQRKDEAERTLNRLEAERNALAALQEDLPASPLIDRVEVNEGFDRALAAALGDDLLIGLENDASSHWRALESGPPMPTLPVGVACLADHVRGPAVLARRLRQIGIIDAEHAAALQPGLAPGQRLVSPDGGLWRWDGLVHGPGSEDSPRQTAAVRIEQRRRLVALDDGVARERATIEETDRALATCEERLAVARDEAAGLELRREELADEATSHERGIEEARRAVAAREKKCASLEASLGEIDDEVLEIENGLAEIKGGPGEDRAALSARVEEYRRRSDETAAEAERLAGEVVALDEEVRRLAGEREAAEQHLDEVRQAQSQARLTFERRQSEAAMRKTHREEARRALSEEDTSIVHELAGLDEEISGLATEHDRRAAERESRQRQRNRDQSALEALRQELARLRSEEAVARERQAGAQREWERLEAELGKARTRLEALDDELEARRKVVAEAPEADEGAERITEIDRRLASDRATHEEETAALAEAEQAFEAGDAARREAEAAAAAAHETMALAEAEKERAAGALNEIEQLVRRRLGAPPETLLAVTEGLETAEPEAMAEKLAGLKASRDRIGPVNLRAAEEAEALTEELQSLRREEGELRAAVERFKRAIGTLNREARARIGDVFEKVDGHFRTLFQRLFGGGKAHLRLTNIEDPLNAGLELEAMPPGKKLQSIRLLSGGEKSLAALALVFAFFLAEPSPLCVLDEVDAALDDANVERFLDLMEEIASATGTRFLVVTHHPLTMARMDRLFGVTMVERGVSRLVSVALDQAVEMHASA